MADLDLKTKQVIEELFEMRTGYVLDFSNNSFSSFIYDVIKIDIYHGKGYEEYSSKANKLRQIFKQEDNLKVANLIEALIDYYEDFKLKQNKLTDYDRKKIKEIKITVEILKKKNQEKIYPVEELDNIIQKISTRNAQFKQMTIDEKLKELCNTLEYLLKRKNGFISLDYKEISVGFLNESDIISFRKKIQCFRHASEESIEERTRYTKKQKKFMIEFGIVICNLVYNELLKE